MNRMRKGNVSLTETEEHRATVNHPGHLILQLHVPKSVLLSTSESPPIGKWSSRSGKGPSPFRERPGTRREEADTFTIMLERHLMPDVLIWLAYRSASPEKKSGAKGKGGVVYLWGDFYPSSTNVPKDFGHVLTSEGPDKSGKISFMLDGHKQIVQLDGTGISVLRGTCRGAENFSKILKIKETQGFSLHRSITYTPDSEITSIFNKHLFGENIQEKKKTAVKEYTPCTNPFCIMTNERVVAQLGDSLILVGDFIHSFIELLRTEPRMKLVFDELTKCGSPEDCMSPTTRFEPACRVYSFSRLGELKSPEEERQLFFGPK